MKNKDKFRTQINLNAYINNEVQECTVGIIYLITENFDLAVAPVDDRAVSGVIVGVDLEVQRQTLQAEYRNMIRVGYVRCRTVS